MNLREFWAAEAAKLRDTSHLDLTESDTSLEQNDFPKDNAETQKLIKFYPKSAESEAYKFLWANTKPFKPIRPTDKTPLGRNVENCAWITTNGILVMPLKGYKADNVKFETTFNGETNAIYTLPIKDGKIKYNNQWIKPIASIHTHPPLAGAAGPSPEDKAFTNAVKIPVFILTEDSLIGIWPGYNSYASYGKLDATIRSKLLKGEASIIQQVAYFKQLMEYQTGEKR